MASKKKKKQSSQSTKYGLAAVAIVVLIGVVLFASNRTQDTIGPGQNEDGLTPVKEISHGHGISIDHNDPSKLYIATHNGLLVLVNDQELARIGNSQDDLMGFSPHPETPDFFFSSGHPQNGGNIGFQRSEDGGMTWTVVSPGINGPVDYHAMAISPVDPKLIYGWYAGALQISEDDGKTWEVLRSDLSDVISLTADRSDRDTLYSSTAQGLLVSHDQGKSWTGASSQLSGAAVTVLSIDPASTDVMFSWSEKLGFAISADKGSKWEVSAEQFSGEPVLYLTNSKRQPGLIYAMTGNNSIYKSTDRAKSWTKIR